MKRTFYLQWTFWAALALFLVWDHVRAPRIDLRFEPPLIAAGSGQTSTAGHCALPK
jgi:hypothetical protein